MCSLFHEVVAKMSENSNPNFNAGIIDFILICLQM